MELKKIVVCLLLSTILQVGWAQSNKSIGLSLGLHNYDLSAEEEVFFISFASRGYSLEGILHYDLGKSWSLWTGLAFTSSQIDIQDYSVTFGTDLTSNGFDLARSYMTYEGTSQSLSVPAEISYDLGSGSLVPYLKMSVKAMFTFNDNMEVRIRESGMPARLTVFPQSITQVFGARIGSAIGCSVKSVNGASYFIEGYVEYMPKAYRENLPGFLLTESSRRDIGLKVGVIF